MQPTGGRKVNVSNSRREEPPKRGRAPREPKEPREKAKHPILRALGRTLATLICLGIMVCSLAAVAAVYYAVQATANDGNLLDLDNIELSQSSTVVATDPDTGAQVEYATLRSSNSHRVWADLEQIPTNLQYAFICTEDKDFYNEPGVNFKRTIGAMVNEYLLPIYSSKQGASTLEQQLIKNLTSDKSASGVEGALRTGAGLVYLASVEPVIQLVLTRTPECCALPCRTDADGGILAADAAAVRQRFTEKPAVLLAGPGLGPSAARTLNALLTADAKWKAAVLDADALNALAAGELGQFPLLPTDTVLTPHPGEAARLLGCSVAQIQTDRPAAAQELAERYGCVAVLKGSGTLIAAPGREMLHNPTGNPGLARGGSGDVLAGMLAALLAQGLAPFDAAACAVWLHGAAADRCAARTSQLTMLPHDILTDLADVVKELTGR